MLSYGSRGYFGFLSFLVDAIFGVRPWVRSLRLRLTSHYLMNTKRFGVNATHQAGQSSRCHSLRTVRHVSAGLSFGRGFIQFNSAH